MSIEALLNLILSLGLLPALFVWLLWKVNKDNMKREEHSNKREQMLMDQLNGMAANYGQIVPILDRIVEHQKELTAKFDTVANSLDRRVSYLEGAIQYDHK